jgi:ribosomal-protein-alanine N-acetyltransferase
VSQGAAAPTTPPTALASAVAAAPPFASAGAEFEIRGPAVGLRCPRAGDAPALYELASDEEVTRYFSWGPYRSQAEASDWLATLPARRGAGVALELAITDRADRLIGITLLGEFSARDRRCVVGTWLGRRHWRTGANPEAKALVARLAFETLGVERLGAYADVRNTRSQAALERLGFEREGVLRAFHRHGGKPRDVVSYSLLRDDWRDSPLAEVEARLSGSPPAGFVVGPRRPTTKPTPGGSTAPQGRSTTPAA